MVTHGLHPQSQPSKFLSSFLVAPSIEGDTVLVFIWKMY